MVFLYCISVIAPTYINFLSLVGWEEAFAQDIENRSTGVAPVVENELLPVIFPIFSSAHYRPWVPVEDAWHNGGSGIHSNYVGALLIRSLRTNVSYQSIEEAADRRLLFRHVTEFSIYFQFLSLSIAGLLSLVLFPFSHFYLVLHLFPLPFFAKKLFIWGKKA